MLIIEARFKKLLLGVCSESAEILSKNKVFLNNTSLYKQLDAYIQPLDKNKIKSVAVTVTPGDPNMIQQVLNYFKNLEWKIRPVHHLDAHFSFIKEPFVGLIGTSSNTEIVIYTKDQYKILGMGIDLSLGNAYYKLSKELNISLKAFDQMPSTNTIPYPEPWLNQETLDFSFAGSYYFTLQHIYPRVLQLTSRAPLLDPCFLKDNKEGMNILIDSFQTSVKAQLVNRVSRTLEYVSKNHPEIKIFAFSGGISANKYLRDSLRELCHSQGIEFRQKNSEDSIEMIRDLVFSKYCRLYMPSELRSYRNYPLGPYHRI